MPLPSRTGLALAALAIAVVALAVAGRGASTIPLESHEIYVAQTAENMLDSGDWLVPRLNGEYRLTKPPASYWLVAGFTRLAGETEVGPAVARLPSILAVAGCALLAFWIGARLFDDRTGLLAGLMCAASVAAFKYGHNARPDMLYALATTAVLATWVGAVQAPRERSGRWAWSLWVLVGLATLVKGPQAPAILLIGLVLHAKLAGRPVRELVARLRPLRGLLIVLAIVLPWFVLLRQAISSDALSHSQLSGELLTIDPLRLFTPFYILRTPVLWLPWALLLPAVVRLVAADWKGPAGMLAFAIVFAMLAFALGPQYRQIYMLPWQVPAMLLFAAAIVAQRWSLPLLGLLAIVVLAAIGWLVAQSGAPGTLAALLCLAVGGGLLFRRRVYAGAVAIALAFAVGLFVGGTVPALWSSARYAELSFVRALERRIDETTPVIVWDIDAAHYSYYLDRPVTGRESLDAVCDWFETRDRDAILVYPAARRDTLAARLSFVPMFAHGDSEFGATRVAAHTGCRTITGEG